MCHNSVKPVRDLFAHLRSTADDHYLDHALRLGIYLIRVPKCIYAYLIVCVCSPVFSSSTAASSNSSECFLAHQPSSTMYTFAGGQPIAGSVSKRRQNCPQINQADCDIRRYHLLRALAYISCQYILVQTVVVSCKLC